MSQTPFAESGSSPGNTYEKIPKSMKDCVQWVVWRRENDTKVPYQARTPQAKASSTNPATWASFLEAVAAASDPDLKLVGIGYMVSPDEKLVMVDTDHQIIDGKLGPVAQAVVALDTYTEYSPSGTGLHAFVEGMKPGKNCKAKDGSLEIYDHSRFFTMTGRHYEGTPTEVMPRQEALTALYEKYLPSASTNGTTNGRWVVVEPENVELRDLRRAATLTAAFVPAEGVRDDFYGALAGGLGRTINDDEVILQFIHETATVAKDEDEAKTKKRTDFARRTLEKLRAGSGEPPTGFPRAIELAKDGFADIIDNITKLLREPAVTVTDLADIDVVGGDLAFPDSAIIGLGREFTDMYSAHFEAPRVFWYHAFLTFLGAELSKKVVLASGNNEPPRMYTAILGTSGWTRKSSAMDETENFFNAIHQMYGGEQSETGLLVLHGSGSAEGIVKKIMKEQKRPILMKFDELKMLIDKGRQDGSQLMPLLTNAWGKGRWSNDTLTYSVELVDAAISLLSACTLKTFESAFRGSEADIGFLNRLWLVPGQRDKVIAVPETVDGGALSKLVFKVGGTIRSLVAGDQQRRAIYDPEARRFWVAWYNAFRQATESETASRVDSYGLRLCILLAACEQTVIGNNLVITSTAVQAVIEMLEWQLKVRQQYYPTIADNQTAAMEEKIRKVLARAPGQWFRRKDVYNLTNAGRVGTAAFDKAIDGTKRNAEVEERAEPHKYNKRSQSRWYRSISQE